MDVSKSILILWRSSMGIVDLTNPKVFHYDDSFSLNPSIIEGGVFKEG